MSKHRRCGNKVRHPTKAGAIFHRRTLTAWGAAPGRYAVYKCSNCKNYHVGHTKRRRRANP